MMKYSLVVCNHFVAYMFQTFFLLQNFYKSSTLVETFPLVINGVLHSVHRVAQLEKCCSSCLEISFGIDGIEQDLCFMFMS